MDHQTRQAYVNEVKFQKEMLQRLKKWLRNLMLISSVALVLIVSGQNLSIFLKCIGFILMAVSITGCVMIGLGIRNGQNNVNKIIDYINK